MLTLKEEKKNLETSLHETEAANQVLHDEHQALQIAYASIEEKLKILHVSFISSIICHLKYSSYYLKLQYENIALVERLMTYKAHDAEILNRENENFLK